jgi:uncharacterized membrane protein YfcA
MPLYEALLVAIAGVAGAVAAITGFGIGSLLTPALAVSVGTKLAVAAAAIPHVAATSLRLWLLRAAVDRRVLLTFGVPSAAGGLIGAAIQAVAPNVVLSAVLGVLLVFAGVLELSGLSGRLQFPDRWSTVAGVLSGLFGGLVGNQGGIRSAALLRLGLSREALVATATASALLVDAARVPVYLVASGGQLLEMWPLIGALTVAVIVGTIVGAPILRRIPEPLFRRLLALLLILLGLGLIAGAIR